MNIREILYFITRGFLPAFLLFNIAIAVSNAQNVKRCGTTEMTNKLIAEFPQIQEAIEKNALERQEYIKNHGAEKQAGCSNILVIPTVFHVIHQNGPENIPDQTIMDAMKVLNEDFRLWNKDQADIDGSFKPIIGEALIEFRLAKKDPSGNSTDGIDRIESSLTISGDDNAKLNPWPRNRYLNIWVVQSVNGAAAYTYLPSTAHFIPNYDGIIADYSYLGVGERTLTHEVGHWLDLLHTWGSGNDPGLAANCNKDDDVSDTPLTEGTGNFSCDTNQVTCGTLDNVQNYLDYSACLPGMFTEGQVARMRTALGMTWAQRNELTTVSNLLLTGVYEGSVAFNSDMVEVCPGSSIFFEDESTNGICTWGWSFPGGVPSTSTERNPTVIYNTPGTYDVTLTVGNDTGQATTTSLDYITVSVAANLPYSESFANGFDWQIQGIGGNAWEYTTTSFDSDGGSIMLDNFNGSVKNDKDIAISPLLDLSVLEDANITFRAAYAQKTSGNIDKLKLIISNDCGETWVENSYFIGPFLYGNNGINTSAFTPTDTSHWLLITSVAILPEFLNENFRFMFEFNSDQGNNIYIDNINITGTYKPVPFLLSPSNYAIEQPFSVLLDWSAVPGVSLYEYEIDTVATFDSPFLVIGTKAYIDASDNGPDTEYQLSGLDSNWTIYWRVRTNDGSANSDWTSTWRFNTYGTPILSVSDFIRSEVSLKVYPNPVYGEANIVFSLEEAVSYLSLDIYDLMGRRVQTVYSLDNGTFSAGTHQFVLANIKHPGIYLVKLETDNISSYSKITIAR